MFTIYFLLYIYRPVWGLSLLYPATFYHYYHLPFTFYFLPCLPFTSYYIYTDQCGDSLYYIQQLFTIIIIYHLRFTFYHVYHLLLTIYIQTSVGTLSTISSNFLPLLSFTIYVLIFTLFIIYFLLYIYRPVWGLSLLYPATFYHYYHLPFTF